jgi:hypothetical protein
VILDELGYLPFSQTGGALLFHLISKLYEHTSLIITTNLEVDPKRCTGNGSGYVKGEGLWCSQLGVGSEAQWTSAGVFPPRALCGR